MLASAQELLDLSNKQAYDGDHQSAVNTALKAIREFPHSSCLNDLHERISISGYYSGTPEHKISAADSCQTIARGKNGSWQRKTLARQN